MADVERTGEQQRLITHNQYVAMGYCPDIMGPMWCFKRAGHEGQHEALSLVPSPVARYITWGGLGARGKKVR